MRLISTALACLLPLAAPLAAQTGEASAPSGEPDATSGRDFLTIGAGAATVPEYEGASSNRILPVPGAVGRIGGFSFLIAGNQLSVDLIPDSGNNWDFQLGPSAAIGFNRNSLKNISDPRIRALGKVGTAVELGAFAGVARCGVITSPYDRLSFSTTWRRDVADGHGGTLVSPTLSYITPLSKSILAGLLLSADWADSKYASTYFGVTPAQSAASTLPAFTARSGWKDWSIGAATNISLSGDVTHGLSVIGGVSYTRLLNDFAASPVVSIAGKADQWMAGLGLAYTF